MWGGFWSSWTGRTNRTDRTNGTDRTYKSYLSYLSYSSYSAPPPTTLRTASPNASSFASPIPYTPRNS